MGWIPPSPPSIKYTLGTILILVDNNPFPEKIAQPRALQYAN
jgi:hypothetical protein